MRGNLVLALAILAWLCTPIHLGPTPVRAGAPVQPNRAPRSNERVNNLFAVTSYKLWLGRGRKVPLRLRQRRAILDLLPTLARA